MTLEARSVTVAGTRAILMRIPILYRTEEILLSLRQGNLSFGRSSLLSTTIEVNDFERAKAGMTDSPAPRLASHPSHRSSMTLPPTPSGPLQTRLASSRRAQLTYPKIIGERFSFDLSLVQRPVPAKGQRARKSLTQHREDVTRTLVLSSVPGFARTHSGQLTERRLQ